MIYINEDPKEWAAKFGIGLKQVDCKCGKKLNFTKPFAIKGYRGIESENCNECGKTDQSILVPTGKDKLEFWGKVKNRAGLK